MEAGARVCPFCGEPPGPGVFCTACGRNLEAVRRLPTRTTWERGRAAGAEAIGAFLATMHEAGDPGAVRMAHAQPGFLGRTRHIRGWVVRAVARGHDDPSGRYEPGLFLTVEGHLHRLESATRGAGQRAAVVYVDLVGPEVTEPAQDERLAAELAAVLRANGLDSAAR